MMDVPPFKGERLLDGRRHLLPPMRKHLVSIVEKDHFTDPWCDGSVSSPLAGLDESSKRVVPRMVGDAEFPRMGWQGSLGVQVLRRLGGLLGHHVHMLPDLVILAAVE